MAGLDRVTDATFDANSVLVLRPRSETEADAVRGRLRPDDPGRVCLLAVSFTRPPDRFVAEWTDAAGARPRDAIVVTSTDQVAEAGSTAVETVSSPGDLTGVGMKSTRHLARWDEADEEVAVVVESLTHLLEYAHLEALYRFLHVLVARLDAIGARGRFHLDPTAHDDATVNTLKSLFRVAVERVGDGDWRVQAQ
jgi:hypothetical protein